MKRLVSIRKGTGQTPPLDLDSAEIDLSAYPNVLDEDVMEQLCQALETNEVVTSINLSNNALSNAMAERLGILINANANIQKLTLAHCELSDVAMSTILRCARKHKVLRSLNVSRNPISNTFLPELQKLIQSSSSVQEVVLMDTNISFEGMIPVVQAMVSNTSLLACSLPFTLGHELIFEVQKILERNYKMQSHVAQGVDTMAAVMKLAKKEEELKRTLWKAPAVANEGAGASHRLRSVAGKRDEWADPTAKTHMMYLTLLDRKANFAEESRKEKERQRLLLDSVVLSPRKQSPRLLPSPRSSRR